MGGAISIFPWGISYRALEVCTGSFGIGLYFLPRYQKLVDVQEQNSYILKAVKRATTSIYYVDSRNYL
jgi:hypothetical protein